jgi:hypothetical protein
MDNVIACASVLFRNIVSPKALACDVGE